MNITLEQVRAELSKDDLSYINTKIERLMQSAKAALVPAIGYEDGLNLSDAFEELSNTFIVEYCRAFLDGVDNVKILLGIQTQLQALLPGGTDA